MPTILFCLFFVVILLVSSVCRVKNSIKTTVDKPENSQEKRALINELKRELSSHFPLVWLLTFISIVVPIYVMENQIFINIEIAFVSLIISQGVTGLFYLFRTKSLRLTLATSIASGSVFGILFNLYPPN
ncbi:hypothetical protein [Salinithrix halophila]|uniref:Uncharacterized protein n=1 Tax=Salinithrix halophila TaxID=1485204 RepID=A0ABV8JIS1_9BACL